jgi:ribonuclease VapC
VIVDSSVVVSILTAEADYERLVDRIGAEEAVGIGGPTLVESGIVLCAKIGLGGRTLLARFIEESELEVLPFGQEHWQTAVDAFLRFGKGRHPAALNFGDCLAYATARLAEEPLFCLGQDFAKTDLAVVAW